MARNMMSNHTDMQDKYCGHSKDINLFKANTKVAAVGRPPKRSATAYGRGTSFAVSFVLALNRVNVVTVTALLVLHVGVIGHHVPCHYDFMFLAVRTLRACAQGGSRGPCPPGGGVWGGARPGQQGGLGGGTPPNDSMGSDLLVRSWVQQPNLRTDLLLRNLLLVESTRTVWYSQSKRLHCSLA